MLIVNSPDHRKLKFLLNNCVLPGEFAFWVECLISNCDDLHLDIQKFFKPDKCHCNAFARLSEDGRWRQVCLPRDLACMHSHS